MRSICMTKMSSLDVRKLHCPASIKEGATRSVAHNESAVTASVTSQRADSKSSSIPCGAWGACSRSFLTGAEGHVSVQ